MLGLIDKLLLEHVGLPHVLDFAVHLVNFFGQMSQGGHSEPLLLLALFYQSTPSCLKVRGGWWWPMWLLCQPKSFWSWLWDFWLWDFGLGLDNMKWPRWKRRAEKILLPEVIFLVPVQYAEQSHYQSSRQLPSSQHWGALLRCCGANNKLFH